MLQRRACSWLPPRCIGSLQELSAARLYRCGTVPPWGSRATAASCLCLLFASKAVPPDSGTGQMSTLRVTWRHLFSLGVFLILILLPCPPPLCLTQSQCNLPEIEFRQAPGKSGGSTQLKLQLKIFLLDLPALRQGARVPRSWRQKATPPPKAHSSAGLFQNSVRKGSLGFKNGFLNSPYGTFFSPGENNFPRSS